MNIHEFITTWNECNSAIEFSRRTGQSAKGACVRAHRLRLRGHDVKRMASKVSGSFAVRFWKLVVKTNSCWIWMGSRNKKGYGQISQHRRGLRPLQAHRASWEMQFGKIPDGMHVLHRCDDPSCVNPDHLFLGTPKQNTHDMMHKERGHWQRKAPRKKKRAERTLAEM